MYYLLVGRVRELIWGIDIKGWLTYEIGETVKVTVGVFSYPKPEAHW